MKENIAGSAGDTSCGLERMAVPQDKRAAVFEPGYRDREGLFTFVTNPPPEDLDAIYALSLQKIGFKLAPLITVRSVYTHNPMSVWGVYRAARADRQDARLSGYSSYLPLNEQGHEALKAGILDPLAPDLGHLAPAGEDPVALYMWAIVAPRMADLAGALIAYAFGLELYDRLPLYATISTEGGLKSLQKSRRSPLADTATVGTLFEVRGFEEDRRRLFALDIQPGKVSSAIYASPSPKTTGIQP